jgi:hypothetical protein
MQREDDEKKNHHRGNLIQLTLKQPLGYLEWREVWEFKEGWMFYGNFSIQFDVNFVLCKQVFQDKFFSVNFLF